MGQAKDGDMILNDVGAQWDGECNDVSRGWPCNGKYSKEQRMLYECCLLYTSYYSNFQTMLQFVISHDIQVHSIHYTKHFQKKSVLQSQHCYLDVYKRQVPSRGSKLMI